MKEDVGSCREVVLVGSHGQIQGFLDQWEFKNVRIGSKNSFHSLKVEHYLWSSLWSSQQHGTWDISSPQVSGGARRLFVLEREKIWACGGWLASLVMLVWIYILFSVSLKSSMLLLYGVSGQPVDRIRPKESAYTSLCQRKNDNASSHLPTLPYFPDTTPTSTQLSCKTSTLLALLGLRGTCRVLESVSSPFQSCPDMNMPHL